VHSRIVLRPLLAFPLALAVVAANVYWDYVSAPSGLLYSPGVALIACSIVLFWASPWNPYLKSGLCAGLLMLQDAGLKLYGGGDHDVEGLGFCNLLLLLGALLSLVPLIMALGRNKTIATRHKAGAIGLFVALLVGHLLLFGSLGVGHYVGSYVE
jgi:hypothetical protein